MKKILIVEDNRLDRKILSHILQKAFGSQIILSEAQDGLEALKIVAKSEFKLVITDLIMPNMEGLELIQKMRSNIQVENIIAISGSNPYYLYLAKKLGVHSVFTKPIDQLRFIEAVKDMLHIENSVEKEVIC